MEISRLSPKKDTRQTSSISNKKVSGSFSDEFNSAQSREKGKELGRLLDSIKRKGKRIIETRSITAVRQYKEDIKEYLSLVLKDAYRVEKLRSLYDGNPTTFVDIINNELNELAQAVLVEEKGTISVVNMIEHIEGLLVDIYR